MREKTAVGWHTEKNVLQRFLADLGWHWLDLVLIVVAPVLITAAIIAAAGLIR